MEYQWQMISKDIIIKGHLGSLHMSKSYDNCNSFNVICTAKLLRNFKGLSCQYQRKLKVGDSPEGFIFNYKNNLLYDFTPCHKLLSFVLPIISFNTLQEVFVIE